MPDPNTLKGKWDRALLGVLLECGLCRDAGGELDQIQFLPGHVAVQTTEMYLGCKQRLKNALNDRIGIEPNG